MRNDDYLILNFAQRTEYEEFCTVDTRFAPYSDRTEQTRNDLDDLLQNDAFIRCMESFSSANPLSRESAFTTRSGITVNLVVEDDAARRRQRRSRNVLS
jgi:hypothetical protein